MTPEILRSLVVDATPDGPLEQRLEAALQIANEHKGSLVAVCPAWPTGMSFADALVRGPLQSMAREEEMRQAIATSRATFDRLTQGSSVTTDWCDSIADPAVVLREHGLLADLIIMSLPRESEVAQADPVDLAAATGTPILRLGAATSREAFRRVLIGWKDCRESRCALRAALPILRRAETILIVGVGDEASSECLRAVQRYLCARDMNAQHDHVPDNGKGAAASMTEIARRDGYGLLVAGARAQGRWKERIVGGATEELLRTDVNWLLAN